MSSISSIDLAQDFRTKYRCPVDVYVAHSSVSPRTYLNAFFLMGTKLKK